MLQGGFWVLQELGRTVLMPALEGNRPRWIVGEELDDFAPLLAGFRAAEVRNPT